MLRTYKKTYLCNFLFKRRKKKLVLSPFLHAEREHNVKHVCINTYFNSLRKSNFEEH